MHAQIRQLKLRKSLAFRYWYLSVLIIDLILKIILKEREERKQQRLRENTVSPAVAGDEVQDAESGTEEQAADPEQAAGTSGFLLSVESPRWGPL